MIIHTCAQHSEEWFRLRAGIPTASECDALLTPEFKIKTGEGPKSYLAKKVAEKWLGRPLLTFSSGDMEQGTILEEYALPWYVLTYEKEIQRVGLCTTDDGKVGCSPDGVFTRSLPCIDGEFIDGGIEIKCPQANTHVGYLLAGTLPKDYAVQVHVSMFVTGAAWWKFLSWRGHTKPSFPPLLLHIERDEEIQDTIGEALGDFNTKLDAALKKLNYSSTERAGT